MNATETGQSAANQLLKTWEDYIANCQSMVEQLTPVPTLSTATGSFPFVNAWQHLAGSLGIRPDLANNAFKIEQIFSSLAPALGATREYQQIAQRMRDLSARFQQAYAELVKAGADVNQQAMRAVQAHSASDASHLNEPAARYDAWVEGAEKAYAQLAHGDTFGRLFGELCNILSGFKVERGKLLEALARHLDLPSRAELNTLHQQVNELTQALRRIDPTPSKPPSTQRKTPKSVDP